MNRELELMALLREAGEYGGLTPDWYARRDAALSQQAEPASYGHIDQFGELASSAVSFSVPAPAQDEREAFEAWAAKRGLSLVKYAGGMYVSDCTMWANIAWQERADCPR